MARHRRGARLCAIALCCLLPLVAGGSAAQDRKAAPRIICWFDKSGKVQLGCGNVVPPEYLGHPTRELTRQGITVNRAEAPTAEQLRARQEEEARRKAELARLAEQQRRDRALLDSYTDVSEIDARRDRDLHQLELTIRGLETNLKQLQTRYGEANARADGFRKQQRDVPPVLGDELSRISADLANVTRLIEERRKDVESARVRYEELRARYLELKAAQAVPPPVRR